VGVDRAAKAPRQLPRPSMVIDLAIMNEPEPPGSSAAISPPGGVTNHSAW